jgi:hypothetical protein
MAGGRPPGRLPSTSLFEDGTYDIEEFRKVFLETKDIYEYQAAIKLVGSWAEWNRLKRDSKLFQDSLAEWIVELKAILRSESFAHIVELSQKDNAQALAASRWLIEEVMEKPNGKKRGRPTKQAVAQEARRIAQSSKEEEEELKRIREAAVSPRKNK